MKRSSLEPYVYVSLQASLLLCIAFVKKTFSLQFVVEDDKEQLVPSDENEGRRSYFSDRREQTQQLRDQQEEPRYGSERISFQFENFKKP